MEFESVQSVRAAQHLLRDNILGREPILSPVTERHVVGFVQTPEFELTAFGPASEGAAGPVRWRWPSRSRTLRGRIVEGDRGQTYVVATFRGRPWVRSRASRTTEAWLLDWLRAMLDERA